MTTATLHNMFCISQMFFSSSIFVLFSNLKERNEAIEDSLASRVYVLGAIITLFFYFQRFKKKKI